MRTFCQLLLEALIGSLQEWYASLSGHFEVDSVVKKRLADKPRWHTEQGSGIVGSRFWVQLTWPLIHGFIKGQEIWSLVSSEWSIFTQNLTILPFWNFVGGVLCLMGTMVFPSRPFPVVSLCSVVGKTNKRNAHSFVQYLLSQQL